MAEVLVQFDTAIEDADGTSYVARICGREVEHGHWEGWVEFAPEGGDRVLRTPRETTQPDHDDLEYWAGGLTVAYLEGALGRAQRPETPDLRPRETSSHPTYDRPAASPED